LMVSSAAVAEWVKIVEVRNAAAPAIFILVVKFISASMLFVSTEVFNASALPVAARTGI